MSVNGILKFCDNIDYAALIFVSVPGTPPVINGLKAGVGKTNARPGLRVFNAAIM